MEPLSRRSLRQLLDKCLFRPSKITRFEILFRIADAIAFVHSRGIVLRGLTSENICFDKHGPKLIGFGLAHRIPTEREDDLYDLEFCDGTPQYNSAEVAYNRPHGKATDVFSFSVVAWETLSKKVPYQEVEAAILATPGHNNVKKFYNYVHGDSLHRPMINGKWPSEFQDLLESGWAADPKMRPNLDTICTVLHTLSR